MPWSPSLSGLKIQVTVLVMSGEGTHPKATKVPQVAGQSWNQFFLFPGAHTMATMEAFATLLIVSFVPQVHQLPPLTLLFATLEQLLVHQC